MNRSKLLLTTGLIVTGGALLATGCTGKNTKNEAAASPTAQATSKPYVRGDISVSIYDRGTVPASVGTIENNLWTKYLNEKGPANVKFVPIPRFESQQKLNVLFASSSAPDLIFEYAPNIKNPLYDQKMMMPIDDMIEKYSTEYKALLKQYPQLKKAGMKPDGKMYEFARFNEAYPSHIILIRTDWLKKLNLEIPKTTEDFIKVAKAFTEQDPDGNGKKDTYGTNLSANATIVVDQMFGNPRSVKDGQLINDMEKVKAALAFKKELYASGVIDKDFANDKNGAKSKQDFVNGKIGIYLVAPLNWQSFAVNEYATLKKNVPEATIAPMNLPKSPTGEYNILLNNPIQATAFVNAKASNPEAIMRYVDFLVKPETGKTIAYGKDGEHSKLGANGCPEQLDAEKFKNEVAWNGDFQMLFSKILDTKCGTTEASFNLNDPAQKEFLDIYKKSIALIDPKKPLADLTHSEHMPTLPKDLQQIATALDQPNKDLITKAILSGDKYTTDQAIQDMVASNEKAGLKQIDDWYKAWYNDNKDKAFLAKDILEIEKQQHGK